MIDDVRELAFGLSAAMFICGAVCAERAGKISAPRALQVLGDASFALYLVHYPVLAIIAKVLLRFPPLAALPVEVVFVVLVAGSVVAGLIAHWVIERPMMAYLKQRFR